jgi:methylaspartate ammonia-lyase
MKIKQALFTAGYSSFYFDDQQAIKNGAGHDGFIYTGAPVTPGLPLFVRRVNAYPYS